MTRLKAATTWNWSKTIWAVGSFLRGLKNSSQW